jgi:hypothetical protein
MDKDEKDESDDKQKKENHRALLVPSKEVEEDPVEVYLEDLQNNPWTRYFRGFIITEAKRWLQSRLELESFEHGKDKVFIRFKTLVDIAVTADWNGLKTNRKWKYERVISSQMSRDLPNIINLSFGFKELFHAKFINLWRDFAKRMEIRLEFFDKQKLEIKIPLVKKENKELFRLLRFERQDWNQMKMESFTFEKWEDKDFGRNDEEFDCSPSFGKEFWVIESGTSLELILDIIVFYCNWDRRISMDCKNRDWDFENISKFIAPKFITRPLSDRKWRLETLRIHKENSERDEKIKREVLRKVKEESKFKITSFKQRENLALKKEILDKIEEEEEREEVKESSRYFPEPPFNFNQLPMRKKGDKEESMSTADPSEPVLASPQRDVHENSSNPNYHPGKVDWEVLGIRDPIEKGENCPLGVPIQTWDTLADWIESDWQIKRGLLGNCKEIEKISRNFTSSKEEVCKDLLIDFKEVMEETRRRIKIRNSVWHQRVAELEKERKVNPKAEKRYRKYLDKEVYGIPTKGEFKLTDSEEEWLDNNMEEKIEKDNLINKSRRKEEKLCPIDIKDISSIEQGETKGRLITPDILEKEKTKKRVEDSNWLLNLSPLVSEAIKNDPEEFKNWKLTLDLDKSKRGKEKKKEKGKEEEKESPKIKTKTPSFKILSTIISSKKTLEIASNFKDIDNSSISSFSKRLYNCGNFYSTVPVDLHKDYLQREDWIYLILFMAFIVVLMINLLWIILWIRNKVLDNYTKTLVKQIILDRDKEIELWTRKELEKLRKNPEDIKIETEMEKERDPKLIFEKKKGDCDISVLGGIAIILVINLAFSLTIALIAAVNSRESREEWENCIELELIKNNFGKREEYWNRIKIKELGETNLLIETPCNFLESDSFEGEILINAHFNYVCEEYKTVKRLLAVRNNMWSSCCSKPVVPIEYENWTSIVRSENSLVQDCDFCDRWYDYRYFCDYQEINLEKCTYTGERSLGDVTEAIDFNWVNFPLQLLEKSFIRLENKFVSEQEFVEKFKTSELDFDCNTLEIPKRGSNLLFYETQELDWKFEEDFCTTIANITTEQPIRRKNIIFCSGVKIILDNGSDLIGLKAIEGLCVVKVLDIGGWINYINISNSSFTWTKGIEKVACNNYTEGVFVNCSDLSYFTPFVVLEHLTLVGDKYNQVRLSESSEKVIVSNEVRYFEDIIRDIKGKERSPIMYILITIIVISGSAAILFGVIVSCSNCNRKTVRND